MVSRLVAIVVEVVRYRGEEDRLVKIVEEGIIRRIEYKGRLVKAGTSIKSSRSISLLLMSLYLLLSNYSLNTPRGY